MRIILNRVCEFEMLGKSCRLSCAVAATLCSVIHSIFYSREWKNGTGERLFLHQVFEPSDATNTWKTIITTPATCDLH